MINSAYFLIFIPLIILAYYMMPIIRAKNIILFICSIFLLSAGSLYQLIYILVMLFANYVLSNIIYTLKNNKYSKVVLTISIVINILMHIFIKYNNFISEIINKNAHINIGSIDKISSIGITFYTLYIISYLIEVYNEKYIEKDFINYALCVVFFPRMFALSNITTSEFLSQIKYRIETKQKIIKGIIKATIGLGKVCIISMFCKNIWDNIYQIGLDNISRVATLLGIISIILSIYYLLSGLMDLCIGLALVFGFSFREGYDYPLFSYSFVSFWDRWYISATNWFKINLYNPLKVEKKEKTSYITNIFFTWIIMSLWYKLSAGFILWGVLSGIFLYLESYYFSHSLKKLKKGLRFIYTYIVIILTFAPIGCRNLTDALKVYKALFLGSDNVVENVFKFNIIYQWPLLLIIIIGCFPFFKNVAVYLYKKAKFVKVVGYVFILGVFILSVSTFKDVDNYLEGSNKLNLEVTSIIDNSIILQKMRCLTYKSLNIRLKNSVYRARDGYLMPEFYTNNKILMDKQINSINNFVKDEKNINYYLSIIPSKQIVLDDKKINYMYGDNENDYIKKFQDSIDEKIRFIDSSNSLKQNKNQEIYYKTDTSLNSLGSHIVYKRIASEMNLDISDDTFESILVSKDFTGNLARESQLSDNKEKLNILINKHDEFKTSVHYVYLQEKNASMYDVKSLKKENKLDIILRGKQPIIKIKSTSKNTEGLLVVSNMTSNSIIPLICSKYSNVVLINTGMFKGNVKDVLEDEKIKNVLFLLDSNETIDDKNLVNILSK